MKISISLAVLVTLVAGAFNVQQGTRDDDPSGGCA
jgi:hypothetical protein